MQKAVILSLITLLVGCTSFQGKCEQLNCHGTIEVLRF